MLRWSSSRWWNFVYPSRLFENVEAPFFGGVLLDWYSIVVISQVLNLIVVRLDLLLTEKLRMRRDQRLGFLLKLLLWLARYRSFLFRVDFKNHGSWENFRIFEVVNSGVPERRNFLWIIFGFVSGMVQQFIPWVLPRFQLWLLPILRLLRLMPPFFSLQILILLSRLIPSIVKQKLLVLLRDWLRLENLHFPPNKFVLVVEIIRVDGW